MPASSLRLRRILVPLDFSGRSRQALPFAIAFAEKFGARIVLIHVVVPVPVTAPELGVAYVNEDLRARWKNAEKALQERGAKLLPARLYERGIVGIGHPGSQIVDIAEEIKADLIVLTTHGHSGLKRFFMGSTAERVVRHAKCPVLTVRNR